ncbi:phosphate/phosphite/phosphonate ABC transporter substrate-binding protein [bacterium]|nr:phosphate/phosphite/phosphonate ABC transporter substrate-binding protein [bacterium]NBX83388.1 phosphate/phosphite/phosphonate ABC transporter substrate-binding protein [bacterium]
MPQLFGILPVVIILFISNLLEAREYKWGLLAPNNQEEESRKWESLSKFIFNEKGDTVKFVPFPSEQELGSAVNAHQIDLVVLRPHEYLGLNINRQLQAISSFVFNGQTHHFSHFVVNGKSSAKTLLDLKGKRLGLGRPSSASSHKIPTAELKKLGIKPSKFFKSVREGLSHSDLELGVARGELDVASNSSINRDSLIQDGKVKASDTRIIWTSEPLANELLVGGSQFLESAEGKKAVGRIQILFNEKSSLSDRPSLPSPWTGLAPVSKAVIDHARKTPQ